MTAFNAEAYKTTTHAQWQDAAKAWNDWGRVLQQWLGPATETMLDMAGVAHGSHVLDVAAGAGEQSLAAAERVGAAGRVLATDISENILEYAAENARAAGHEQLDTLVCDGEVLDVPPASFDAAISRVGLIYFPDQQAALGRIRRALKAGGRFAAMVYSTPDRNGFFSTPVSIIRERAALPPPLPGQPGPFSLGGSGVLANVLQTAGFEDIEEHVIEAPLCLPNASDCLRFEKESFGALHQMLSSLSPEKRESVWDEIADALSAYETKDGFVGPCEMVVVSGRNGKEIQ